MGLSIPHRKNRPFRLYLVAFYTQPTSKTRRPVKKQDGMRVFVLLLTEMSAFLDLRPAVFQHLDARSIFNLDHAVVITLVL